MCKQYKSQLNFIMQQNPTIGKKFLTQPSQTSYKTFLLLTKAAKIHHPTHNLLITNFKQSKVLIGNKNNQQTKPIHSPCFQKKISRIKSAKNADFTSQLPLSQRMNSLRVNRRNEFNRRSFQSVSTQRNSFYGKSIRKCKSVLIKFQIQNVVQNMVAKKQLTDRSKTFQQQQQLLDQFKAGLVIDKQSLKMASNMKKIIIAKASTPLKAHKLALNEPNTKQKQKYKNTLKHLHSKLKRLQQEDSDLRPWGETKRITELTYSIQKKQSITH